MTREELKEVFAQAKENKLDVYVAVTIPGQDDYEYIVNKNISYLEYFILLLTFIMCGALMFLRKFAV